jgi:large subunit ribosomal protein L21
MFAILETGSKQYKVEVGDVLEIELLDPELVKKNTVMLESVLLVKDDKGVHVGDPFVKNARIKAKVLEQIKADKVTIFKKRAKETYRRTRGHRQKLQQIQIEKIEIKAEKSTKESE